MSVERAQRRLWVQAGLTVLVVLLAMPFFDGPTRRITATAFIAPLLLVTVVRSLRTRQATGR